MVTQFCVQVTGTCFLAHWEMENGWQTQDLQFIFSIRFIDSWNNRLFCCSGWHIWITKAMFSNKTISLLIVNYIYSCSSLKSQYALEILTARDLFPTLPNNKIINLMISYRLPSSEFQYCNIVLTRKMTINDSENKLQFFDSNFRSFCSLYWGLFLWWCWFCSNIFWPFFSFQQVPIFLSSSVNFISALLLTNWTRKNKKNIWPIKGFTW